MNRKPSLQALAMKLAEKGVPFRISQSKDGETTIEITGPAETKFAPKVNVGKKDIRAEFARRIDAIPEGKVRAGGHR